jgi:predicted DNA-binding transcriptional regulator AlpA
MKGENRMTDKTIAAADSAPRSTFPQLLTKEQVAELVGLHLEGIMTRGREGTVPKPIRLGNPAQHAVRFLETEIVEWLKARVADRDNAVPVAKSVITRDRQKPKPAAKTPRLKPSRRKGRDVA